MKMNNCIRLVEFGSLIAILLAVGLFGPEAGHNVAVIGADVAIAILAVLYVRKKEKKKALFLGGVWTLLNIVLLVKYLLP